MDFCIGAEFGEWGVDAMKKIWYDTHAKKCAGIAQSVERRTRNA